LFGCESRLIKKINDTKARKGTGCKNVVVIVFRE